MGILSGRDSALKGQFCGILTDIAPDSSVSRALQPASHKLWHSFRHYWASLHASRGREPYLVNGVQSPAFIHQR